MAHFAKLDSNNIVEYVIVVANSDSGGGQLENEAVGIAFCQNHIGDSSSVWKQTSYHANFRGKFAGIGYTYMTGVRTLGVASTDIFLPQKPYASWSVGITTAQWEAPIVEPQVGVGSVGWYKWDEVAYQADSGSPKTVGWYYTTV